MIHAAFWPVGEWRGATCPLKEGSWFRCIINTAISVLIVHGDRSRHHTMRRMHIGRSTWRIIAASILLVLGTLVVSFGPYGDEKPPNYSPYLDYLYSEVYRDVERDRSQSVGDAMNRALLLMAKQGFGYPEQLSGLRIYYNPDSAVWLDGSGQAEPAVRLLASAPTVLMSTRSGYSAMLSTGVRELFDKDAALKWSRQLRMVSLPRGAVGATGSSPAAPGAR